MTNRVVDCGVARPPDADINVIPIVTDIGVPTPATLVDPVNNPLGPANQRPLMTPSNSETLASLGIGVPYNNITGVTST